VNVGRGPMHKTIQIITEPKKDYRLFNPSSVTLKNNRIDVMRYSHSNYCSNRLLPFLEDYSVQNSWISVGVKNLDTGVYASSFLDTKVFGPGAYEDARILKLTERSTFLVFTRFYQKRASICISVVEFDEESYAIKFTLEYKCPSQNQKNWMPRLYKDSVLLYASLENQVIYCVPNILNQKGHANVSISPVKLGGKWRGSSPIIETALGPMGLVHYRRPISLAKKLMPDYVHAFFLIKSNDSKETLEFSTEIEFDLDIQGFVYVSGFEFLDDQRVQLSVGIADCYAVKFNLQFSQIKEFFTKKKDYITKVSVKALEVY
jgi:hypothetical protein